MKKLLVLTFFTLIFACSDDSRVTPPSVTKVTTESQNLAPDLTLGAVRELIFHSLFNMDLNACFDGVDGFTYEILTGGEAYSLLTAGIDPANIDLSVAPYLTGLYAYPDDVKAVLIKSSTAVYLYIPNDGTYGIGLIDNGWDLTNSGVLFPLDWDPNGDSKTTLICVTQEGSYGTGCKCTTRTITVHCSEEGDCVCPGGGQCSGTCNSSSDYNKVCGDSSPFADDQLFGEVDPHTFI